MSNYSRASLSILAVLGALNLSGCGGSDVDAGSELLTCTDGLIPDASGASCVAPPPPVCVAPEVLDPETNQCVVPPDPNAPPPLIFPGENQALLFYNRPQDASNETDDPVYDGWKLHTWNNASCDAYADGDTAWDSGREHDGVEPNYGAYWLLDLKEGVAGTDGACANFIIHKGTSGDASTVDGKEMGGSDFRMPLDQEGEFARMNWTFSGVPIVFENPVASLGVSIGDANAHWLDATTLVWNFDPNSKDVTTAQLVHSPSGNIEIEDDQIINGTALNIEPTELTDEQRAMYPELADMPAFSGNWSAEDAKGVLKSQVILAGYDADGELSTANKVQLAKVLDSLYTAGDNDANEASLGLVYDGDNFTANVWAPTAQSVSMKVYDADKNEVSSTALTQNADTGIWSFSGDSSMDRMYYRYEVTVFHPVSGNLEVLEVTDPYSVSLSTNGRYSQFVNLADDDLKPAGWDTHEIPTVANWEDAIIYEGHIRDFSVRDDSVTEAHRGKYMAFTEDGSRPVEHLRNLAANGLTHFHMLPANDIGSINEDMSATVDLNSTVGELCALNEDAAVCSEADAGATLLSVFEDYSPSAEPAKAQELANDMRGYDQFNWGYDPHHFNAPDGSYATNPEGTARILEMRAMNQALHELGLRVVLDVVYNHTNASGLFDNSVLDKVVPGYYHRYDINSGSIIRETCCDDTEPRNAMMEKLMQDSLLMWTEEYKFDSFRFDIMSQASKDTMLRLRDAVQAVDEDNYFYGEGWTRTDRQYEQANQINMAGSEIGTFNDRIREAVRQGQIFARDESDDALAAQDRVKMGLIGTLSDYILESFNGVASETKNIGGYAEDPADIINYVSKHDNETLWDQFQYALPSDLSMDERVRAQNMGAAIPLMSQGIPFLQLGGEMLRSKSMDRNTYDAGDWFNYVDYTKASNNWNVGLPIAQDNESRWEEMSAFIYAPERAVTMTEIEFASAVFNEFMAIRSGSPLFRLTSGQDIIDRIGFHNIGSRQTQGLIVMSIDDGVTPDSDIVLDDRDPALDALVVVVNTSYNEQSLTVSTATGFELHATQMASVDPTVRAASFSEGTDEGTFTVPALSMAVFTKAQSGDQGYGLSAYATSGAPDVVPYGDTVVHVRGDMNGWSTDDAMSYVGDGVYEGAITLAAGTYGFKIASEDWSTVDFGAATGEESVLLGMEQTLVRSGANMSLVIDEETTYKFRLDAADPEAPVFSVDFEEPFYGTTVYVRGGMNGWSEDDPMDYSVGGIYSRTIAVTAGTHEFKVASADWSTVDYGSGEADGVVMLNEDKFLAVSGANLSLEFPEDGNYIFVFDASNLNEPTMAVYKEDMFDGTTSYIRGSLNGWGTDNPLTFLGNATYSTDIVLDAGSYEFKVASEDWSTVDLGGGESNEVVVGTPLTLAVKGANLTMEIPTSGTYTFTVSGPNPAAPTVTVTSN